MIFGSQPMGTPDIPRTPSGQGMTPEQMDAFVQSLRSTPPADTQPVMAAMPQHSPLVNSLMRPTDIPMGGAGGGAMGISPAAVASLIAKMRGPQDGTSGVADPDYLKTMNLPLKTYNGVVN
jgi:hypothetical protein